MIFNLLRTYREMHTDGVLLLDGEHFCHTLEDVGRPQGVKIAEETCIPEGAYWASVTFSPSFKRDMVVLFNNESDHSITRFGVKYTGIRCHGGNDTDHTAGCPLVAEHSDKNGRVWGSMEGDLTRLVKSQVDKGKKVLFIITEEP
ncbi:MAG TPA: DUF5675 family protein [Candidatus Obscuribacterales bacterium]